VFTVVPAFKAKLAVVAKDADVANDAEAIVPIKNEDVTANDAEVACCALEAYDADVAKEELTFVKTTEAVAA
jgi:hypothetical protein